MAVTAVGALNASDAANPDRRRNIAAINAAPPHAAATDAGSGTALTEPFTVESSDPKGPPAGDAPLVWRRKVVADVKVSKTDWVPQAYQQASLINEPEFKFPTNESLLERKL